MKLPRDLAGNEVSRLLTRHYGYCVTRTKGKHVTMNLTIDGNRHIVTVPRHRDVRVGTLDGIIADVAEFLGLSKREVRETLFG